MDIFIVLSFFTGLIFVAFMKFRRTSLWTGFFFLLFCTVLALTGLIEYIDSGNWYASHPVLNVIIFAITAVAAVFILLFPLITLIMFFVQGIRNLQKEGLNFPNALSLLMSFVILLTLFILPITGINVILNMLHIRSSLTITLFVFLNSAALYFLGLLCIYVLTGFLNTVHWSEKHDFQYIVVLGCQVFGTVVPTLLAGRVEKGMELLSHNPNAILIMSGGQGNGEDISEAEAMKQYAVSHGIPEERIMIENKSRDTSENLLNSSYLMNEKDCNIAVVTNSFHVFRALLIADSLHLKCLGYGSKTKWYFTLNAMIRKFVGYLSLRWKVHAAVLTVILLVVALLEFL